MPFPFPFAYCALRTARCCAQLGLGKPGLWQLAAGSPLAAGSWQQLEGAGAGGAGSTRQQQLAAGSTSRECTAAGGGSGSGGGGIFLFQLV
jgi:hypothetical protein